MCSQQDDPTQYDAPIPSRPRKYELSGTAKAEMEPQPSIALGVIGTMIDEIESLDPRHFNHVHTWQLITLRNARERIAKSEADG